MKLGIAIVIATATLFAQSAHAGYGYGKVGQVIVGRLGHQVFVELLNASISGFPCASTHPGGFRYAFSLQAQGAKEMLATLLAAKAAGQTIEFVGSDTCTIDSQMEDVSYVWLF